MLCMAPEKKKTGKKKVGRPAGRNFPPDSWPVQAHLVPEMKAALEGMAKKNGTKSSEEVRAAIRERLIQHGMWPPPKEAQ